MDLFRASQCIAEALVDDLLATKVAYPFLWNVINSVNSASERTRNACGRVGVVSKVHSRKHAFAVAVGMKRASKCCPQGIEHISAGLDLFARHILKLVHVIESRVVGNVLFDGKGKPPIIQNVSQHAHKCHACPL